MGGVLESEEGYVVWGWIAGEKWVCKYLTTLYPLFLVTHLLHCSPKPRQVVIMALLLLSKNEKRIPHVVLCAVL